jgi:alpha-mannosidase
VIDTIKPAEDGKGFVVRLYESSGCATKARLMFGISPKSIQRSNTLEDLIEPFALTSGGCDIVLRPFQITTLRIT